jgi:hypothetical protein
VLVHVSWVQQRPAPASCEEGSECVHIILRVTSHLHSTKTTTTVDHHHSEISTRWSLVSACASSTVRIPSIMDTVRAELARSAFLSRHTLASRRGFLCIKN